MNEKYCSETFSHMHQVTCELGVSDCWFVIDFDGSLDFESRSMLDFRGRVAFSLLMNDARFSLLLMSDVLAFVATTQVGFAMRAVLTTVGGVDAGICRI